MGKSKYNHFDLQLYYTIFFCKYQAYLKISLRSFQKPIKFLKKKSITKKSNLNFKSLTTLIKKINENFKIYSTSIIKT